ncbi:zinc finger protein 782-like [Hyposmocoma kahamanoa]|uniref:zinc finger protein 782-like n=1 Tax=Hyposmocoma kahamanoa TaxID=1477025 RepID=UPI000E6D9FA6|nr:zinc finger protein 782-like [Hyposmocoma kahamanoa]
MLQNTGPYGPNETPISMSGAVNMSQMSTNGNFTQNLSNMGKIAHQTPEQPSPPYHLPDYPLYNHSSLNLSQQINTFPNYQPPSSHSPYMPPNSTSFHDTSWQNGFFPMNLNAQQKEMMAHEKDIINQERDILQQQKDIARLQRDVQKETAIQSAKESKNTYHNTRKETNINETITSKINTNDENYQLKQEIDIEYQNESNDKSDEQQEISTENTTDDKDSQQSELEETDEDTNDKSKDNDPLEGTENINIKSESNSPENITEETETVDIKPMLDSVFVKLDVEGEPYVDVKVENFYWTDTDYVNPFHRDVNGIQREDVANRNIIDSSVSVNEATLAINNDPKPGTYYECAHCTLVFNHPKRFLIHTKWHSFGLINERRTVFAKEREIWRNQRREARVVNRMNSREVTEKAESAAGKNVFPCKECDKAFTSKGSLKNHRQRYHPTRMRECKICGITVIGWMALRNHVASHGDHSFTCAVCHKVFKHAHSLAKHRDTHLEKTVSCEQCPKKFGTMAQLKMHQKVHERAQRGATYQCSYCAKSFYEAYNLSVHERTHRNERPYNCDICNTSYGTNSSLKRHLKVSHSTSKPFQCSVCHRNFISERIRDRHAARNHAHPDDFRHKCTQCESKFLKLKDLQKHRNKMHPKNRKRRKAARDAEDANSSWGDNLSQTD